jgi:hypothetical protein
LTFFLTFSSRKEIGGGGEKKNPKQKGQKKKRKKQGGNLTTTPREVRVTTDAVLFREARVDVRDKESAQIHSNAFAGSFFLLQRQFPLSLSLLSL